MVDCPVNHPPVAAAVVLQDIERWPTVRAVRDDLAVDHGLVRECFKCARDRGETPRLMRSRGGSRWISARCGGCCGWASYRRGSSRRSPKGHQPPDLTGLRSHAVDLPLPWNAQEQALGLR
jgi:hypothetical protein